MIKSKRMRWMGYVARIEKRRVLYRVLAGKHDRKRPFEGPSRRWLDIRMDLQEVGSEGIDWIDLARDRDRWRAFLKAAMNCRVPYNTGNFLTS